MRLLSRLLSIASLYLFTVCSVHAAPAVGSHAMVATVHPLATDAAVTVLKNGGNAVDAAVAAGLTLGVVNTQNSGLGGGCFILIRMHDGQLIALDGREMAPAQATADMFVRDGKAQRQLSQTGPLAVGVPGALAAYAVAVGDYGTQPLKQLLSPAAEIAECGFQLDRDYAAALKKEAGRLQKFRGSRQVLLHADGTPLEEGETLKQPDLAHTYRQIARHGLDWFYVGPFSKTVAAWMKTNGGIVTAKDFANYRVKRREPIVTSYRDFSVVGFPPPSSGGIHVAQILNVLEPFDLKKIYQDDPAAFTHILAEAMKPAFADRAFWLGDSDFAKVPQGLIGKKYAATLSKAINLHSVSTVAGHGAPDAWDSREFGKHTTHLTVVDSMGNWVAITQTINTSFGSKVIVPGTGVVLNNEMDDFSIQPGVPNAFGLIGGEANAIAPGKRPLSSMSPTIVLKDGNPVMTVGAAGGPKIITQVVLAITQHLDLGLPLDKSVGAPRFHHQWVPNRLFVERTLMGAQRQRLEALGHQVETAESVGVTQAISRDSQGCLHGVHDPRVPGKAAGY
jgi:gamma-glutamyltranspeptidase/glutathione hydrolase